MGLIYLLRLSRKDVISRTLVKQLSKSNSEIKRLQVTQGRQRSDQTLQSRRGRSTHSGPCVADIRDKSKIMNIEHLLTYALHWLWVGLAGESMVGDRQSVGAVLGSWVYLFGLRLVSERAGALLGSCGYRDLLGACDSCDYDGDNLQPGCRV